MKMHDTAIAATAMNRMYRRQRYFYDATRKYYLLGRDRLIERLKPAPEDGVLEIGCGTGRNLILAARRYPYAHFFGVDVSSEMLATARTNIERAGLNGRIRLAQADAASFDPHSLFGEHTFQRVAISYSLSMIPAWRNVLCAAIAALAPSGELHIVDFGDQRRLPAWFGAALSRWLSLFHVSPRADLELQLQTLADFNGGTLLFERPYRGYAQYGILQL